MLIITLMIYQLAAHLPSEHKMGFIHTPRFNTVSECREYLLTPDFGVLRERLALEVAAHLDPNDPAKTREQLVVTSTCELDNRI